jgi:hypothetical protein
VFRSTRSREARLSCIFGGLTTASSPCANRKQCNKGKDKEKRYRRRALDLDSKLQRTRPIDLKTARENNRRSGLRKGGRHGTRGKLGGELLNTLRKPPKRTGFLKRISLQDLLHLRRGDIGLPLQQGIGASSAGKGSVGQSLLAQRIVQVQFLAARVESEHSLLACEILELNPCILVGGFIKPRCFGRTVERCAGLRLLPGPQVFSARVMSSAASRARSDLSELDSARYSSSPKRAAGSASRISKCPEAERSAKPDGKRTLHVRFSRMSEIFSSDHGKPVELSA